MMHYRDGFYLGAAVGYDFAKTKLGSVSGDNTVNPTGISGDAIVGYNFYNNNDFVIGVESFLGVSEANKTENGNMVKPSRHINLALRGGMVYAETLFYAKLGVDIRRFEYDVPNSRSGNYNNAGWLVGVGAEYKIDNIGIRLEYNYSYHEHTNLNLFSDNSTSDKTHYSRILLGAAWYF